MTENEKLTVDEIIEHCNRRVKMFENFPSREKCENWSLDSQYGKEYWEHRQVANYLEELEQYRAIGTVEGYERAIKSSIENYNLYREYKAKVQAFEAIGTIEDFKALKEKNEPKKPILNNPKIDEFYVKEAKLCPVCHSYINDCSGDYCRDCGQRIDWSE